MARLSQKEKQALWAAACYVRSHHPDRADPHLEAAWIKMEREQWWATEGPSK